MGGVVGSPRTGYQGPRLCRRVGQGWQDVGIVEDALCARRSPAAGPEEGPKRAEGDVGAADPAVDGRLLRAVLLHNRADVRKCRDDLNTVPGAGKSRVCAPEKLKTQAAVVSNAWTGQLTRCCWSNEQTTSIAC
eukprot:361538-Chlamydomonas_euryale.AAC.2